MLPKGSSRSLGVTFDSSVPHSHSISPNSSTTTSLECTISPYLLLHHLLLPWKTAVPPNDVPAPSRPLTTWNPVQSVKNLTGKGHFQLKSLQWLLPSQGRAQTFSLAFKTGHDLAPLTSLAPSLNTVSILVLLQTSVGHVKVRIRWKDS